MPGSPPKRKQSGRKLAEDSSAHLEEWTGEQFGEAK